MRHYEATELAARVLGLDPDSDAFDEDSVEQLLWNEKEVSMEDFQKIAELLLPFTVPAQSALSKDWSQGYVHDGDFICKQPSTHAISR